MKSLSATSFRKQHQIFINNFKKGQKKQKHQVKTLDHFLLINHSAGLLLFPEYEALRRILSRKLIRLLRFSLFVHPYAMVTAKPREIRMGKGKGAFSHFVLPTKVGSFFAKIFWCQTQNFCPLFFATRNALKKSGQKFTI